MYNYAQGLRLILSLGIITGKVRGTLWDAKDKKWPAICKANIKPADHCFGPRYYSQVIILKPQDRICFGE